MEALTEVELESLEPYKHLFPKARVKDITIKKNSSVKDTVNFIPKIIRETSWQVRKFVDQELRDLPKHQILEKLWHWGKYHIKYEKDRKGYEQIKTARRTVHDVSGDCDDFTTFIGSCLYELGIRFTNRITKYKQNYFQHIYPIVPMGNGSYITMDCVVNRFNYEEPFSEKEDYTMDLQYLDGIEQEKEKLFGNVDAEAIYGYEESQDLGKLKLKLNLFKNKNSAMPGAADQPKPKGLFNKIKAGVKKVLNAVNKLNPATALLRAGVLAAMKVNMMKVPQMLKWAYLTPAEAQKRGADMGKFGRMKNILTRLEQIFYSAGGNPENLKKAILQGKGNKNREVSGLGLIDPYEIDNSYYDHNTPMPQLLGEIYNDEFVNGTEGTEGLGAVIATGASIAAATSAITLIAGLLKSVGNLFPGKKTEDFSEGATAPPPPSVEMPPPPMNETASDSSQAEEMQDTTDTETVSDQTEQSAQSKLVIPTQRATVQTVSKEQTLNKEQAMPETKTVDDPAPPPPTGIKAFWENNKKWLKPVSIGTVIAGLAYLGYRLIGKKKEGGSTSAGQKALQGFSSHKHKKRKKGNNKDKTTPIALM